MDEETLEIRAVGVTTSNVSDAPMLPDLLEQILPDQEIATVTADGAYDPRRCHNVIAARGGAALIPPRKNAHLWQLTTAGAIARNEAVRAVHISCTSVVATVDRVSPPKSGRGKDALRQTPWPRAYGPRLLPEGC